MISLVFRFCNYVLFALTIIYYTEKVMVRFSHIKHTDPLCNHKTLHMFYIFLAEKVKPEGPLFLLVWRKFLVG